MNGLLTMNDHSYFMDLVLRLGRAVGDPGGLAESQFSTDHEGVGRRSAVAIGVVVLERPEETRWALVEGVGSSEEFWTGSHLTPERQDNVYVLYNFLHY